MSQVRCSVTGRRVLGSVNWSSLLLGMVVVLEMTGIMGATGATPGAFAAVVVVVIGGEIVYSVCSTGRTGWVEDDVAGVFM
ncbi:MAG: hypothetical protein JOS17DRAFT_768772 [Linnemannia elongata]|nr:MAG: hypothetical protein JOS17DRAFT_768772 [Linnemannia elongata]